MTKTIRQILKQYRPGAMLSSADSATVRAEVLASVAFSDRVKAHADGNEWYCIRKIGQYGTKTLHLCWPGGAVPLPLGKLDKKTETKPSKRRRSTDARDKVLAACRAVIQDQIEDFRSEFWKQHFDKVQKAAADGEPIPKYPRCELSGKSLWSNKTHVDHVYPFVRMVDDWLASIGKSFDDIAVKQSRKLKRLTMGEYDESWWTYHKDFAKLRLVEARANMSKGAKI